MFNVRFSKITEFNHKVLINTEIRKSLTFYLYKTICWILNIKNSNDQNVIIFKNLLLYFLYLLLLVRYKKLKLRNNKIEAYFFIFHYGNSNSDWNKLKIGLLYF